MLQYFYKSLNLILPKLCIHCNVKLKSEKILCAECLQTLITVDKDLLKLEYERKFIYKKIIKDFHSEFLFQFKTPIQTLVHNVKYNHSFNTGTYLGNLLAERASHKVKQWKADFIIPIPIHTLRKAERGYNQADYIAKAFSKQLNIKCNMNAIRKNRNTISQTSLNLEERKKNVSEAYSIIKPELLEDKNIILIDDVITTGATVTSVASLLKDCGAKNIYALSVAIAE